ncbi:MAG: hypothetical protein JRF40_14340 [Deltaproteobacteria bacterium]|nr:hypothetical protein [Deltaproteobacteria bacterium]
MNIQKKAGKNRPFWVWIISLFYIFSGTMTLLTVYQIHFGIIPAEPAQLATLRKASMLWSMCGLIPAANIAGGLLLLMLHKLSFYIFSGTIILNIINILRHFVTTGFAVQLNTGSMFGVIVGMGMALVVCIYTYRLKKLGIIS